MSIFKYQLVSGYRARQDLFGRFEDGRVLKRRSRIARQESTENVRAAKNGDGD